jgi:nucleoside-diphosphate-sugar epimerase
MIRITGVGGFVGGHLVADMLASGRNVRAVDIKPPSLGWAPSIALKTGLEQTYRWIYDRMTSQRMIA